MILTINTQEEFDFYIEHLIEAYIMLFSEEPFNRKDVKREYAFEFFKENFEHGLIFILTKKDKESVFGFRTIIDPKRIESFNCIDIDPNSMYLSGIWVDKQLRGTGIGDDLHNHSIDKLKESHNPAVIYVRTPINNPVIEHVLHKYGYDIVSEHRSKLNGIDMDLNVWQKTLLFKNNESN